MTDNEMAAFREADAIVAALLDVASGDYDLMKQGLRATGGDLERTVVWLADHRTRQDGATGVPMTCSGGRDTDLELRRSGHGQYPDSYQIPPHRVRAVAVRCLLALGITADRIEAFLKGDR